MLKADDGGSTLTDREETDEDEDEEEEDDDDGEWLLLGLIAPTVAADVDLAFNDSWCKWC